MPLLKGSATFARFRVVKSGKHPLPDKKDLSKILRQRAFQPLDPAGPDERAQGFVELMNSDAVEFSAGATYEGEFAVFSYRVDEVRLPSAVIKAELEQWRKKFETQYERFPSKKEKSEAKDEIRHTLKSRYPLSSKTYDVSWNLESDLVLVWAGSRKAIDELQAALEQAFQVQLLPTVPTAVAAFNGLEIEALTPTPALSMPDVPELN
ncbi:MAG: recombination-associated protein RdgC [Deltaproteobacteria bacterium]|nr:recombination-associated protein RdgC [Deltaproteobacteria bacterium]